MKNYITIFLNYAKLLLNFIIKYDDEILEAYREIKKDGKITFTDFLIAYDFYKNAGLVIDEEHESEVFEAGALDPMSANRYKKLFINQQTGSECVPNSVRRVTVYNTGLQITEEEFKGFTARLYKSGKLVAGKGMTFRDCLDEYLDYIEEIKGVKIRYVRTKIGSEKYKDYDRLGYARLIGGYITTKYLTDFKTDDIINDNYTWAEKKRYGHAFTEIDTEGAKKHGGNIVENYNVRLGNANIYTNNRLLEFIANKYFFSYSYFIFLDQDVTINGETIKDKKDFKEKEAVVVEKKQAEENEVLKNIDLKGAKNLAKLGIWSGTNPKHPSTRQEASTMDYNLAIFIFKSLGREDLVKLLEDGNTNT